MGGRPLSLVPSSFVWVLSVALAQGNGQKAVQWPLDPLLTLTSARAPGWGEWPHLGVCSFLVESRNPNL